MGTVYILLRAVISDCLQTWIGKNDLVRILFINEFYFGINESLAFGSQFSSIMWLCEDRNHKRLASSQAWISFREIATQGITSANTGLLIWPGHLPLKGRQGI